MNIRRNDSTSLDEHVVTCSRHGSGPDSVGVSAIPSNLQGVLVSLQVVMVKVPELQRLFESYFMQGLTYLNWVSCNQTVSVDLKRRCNVQLTIGVDK